MTSAPAAINPDRLVSLAEASRQTGLSVDELRAAYLAGHIRGRTQKTPSGRVHAYQVVLSSAIAHMERLVAQDSQAKAVDNVIHHLIESKAS